MKACSLLGYGDLFRANGDARSFYAMRLRSLIGHRRRDKPGSRESSHARRNVSHRPELVDESGKTITQIMES
jgi:hypothetical protein